MQDHRCTCKIPRKATTAQLMPLLHGCTPGARYVCPVLDKARREAAKRERTARRLMAAGFVIA